MDLEVKDADVLYKNARALRLKAEALQATAEHEKFIDNLIEKRIVEKIVFERARQFRDGLITLSRHLLAPQISGKTDINEVEVLLDTEFKALLKNFTSLPAIK